MADSVSPAAVVKAAEVEIAAAAEELVQGGPTSTLELASTNELDRLSDLPDEILCYILERLKLHEAARTSVLSRRWTYLFGHRYNISIDIDEFHCKDGSSKSAHEDLVHRNANVIQATKSMLAHNNQHPISLLRIRFLLLEESIDIARCVDNAMANSGIAALHFLPHPDILEVDCTRDDWITYGKRFMRFFYASPHAFGALSHLQMRCLSISTDDMTNVLNACKKLEYLWLKICDCGVKSVLQIEHPHLTTLAISYCTFRRVMLTCLPRLTRFICKGWTISQDQYPLSFGYVPQLSELILSRDGTIHDKTFQLSEFLSNVKLRILDLDFLSERIWIQPEAPKLVCPWLQNLQILCLRCIHEECDLDWTMFLLEAAPLLNGLYIQVWDHTLCTYDDDELYQQLFQKGSNLLTWNAPADLKHYSLKRLTIRGYQIDEKFTRYIKHVVEAAVNLELILLLENHPCKICQFSPSTRFPRTDEERYMIKKKVTEWRSSSIKIGFGI